MKLRCEECGCFTELARGWRAKIVEDEEDPEMDPYVVCYCPTCAQREFGQSERRHREQER
jgi:ribosomal protein L44E